MTRILTIIALLFATPMLAGCGSVNPIAISGDNLFYEHGTGQTPEVIKNATQICAERGKQAEMKLQSCPYYCNTTFKCIDKLGPEGVQIFEAESKKPKCDNTVRRGFGGVAPC